MTDRGIRATCENGHAHTFYLPDHDRQAAHILARFLDGCYIDGSHETAGSPARCGICRARITCELFGYEADAGSAT